MISIVIIIIILLLIGVGFFLYRRKKDKDTKKKIITITQAQAREDEARAQEAEARQASEDGDLYADVVLNEDDVDLTPNDQFLGPNRATPSDLETAVNVVSSLAKDMAIGAALTDLPIHLSKKAAKALSKKLFAKLLVKTSAKASARLAIKLGLNAAKTVSKFANPVSWALLYADLPGALWDITDTGKTRSFKDANTWLAMRDQIKKDFAADLKDSDHDLPITKSPVDKFNTPADKLHPDVTKAQFDQFLKEKDEFLTEIQTRYFDKFYNEAKTQFPNATEQQIYDKVETKLEETSEVQVRAVLKKICIKYGGKYLGNGKCSYKTKQACQNSYSWPLKKDETYSHWDGDKCVYSYGGIVRNICDQESSAQIGYDKDKQTCYIKKPYCDQYTMSYKAKDPEAKNLPNCYKTTGREILETVVGGETVIKDFADLFSSRENCNNECNPETQYCYTITGKGGICLPKANPGEACTTEIDASCYGDSKCKLSAEGLAAALGTATAAVATGGASLGLAGLVAAGAAGRSIHANLGICSAGADGVNPSSPSNPGHYMTVGKKGCYAGLPCPPKVKQADGSTQPYWCKTAFNVCQKPKKKGEWCSAVEKCGKHNGKQMWCGGVPVQCRTWDGKNGDFCEWDSDKCASGYFCDELSRCRKLREPGASCLYSTYCKSGECIGGVCAKKIGSKKYLPKGALCGLANTRCEPDTFCDGFTCKAKKSKGAACVLHNACKSGNCKRGSTIWSWLSAGVSGNCA